MTQQIQYCTTDDGIRLAYSVIGKGSPIVRASHWLSHLEYAARHPERISPLILILAAVLGVGIFVADLLRR